MILNLTLLAAGFALFAAGLWAAWSPIVWALVLIGVGLMLFGAVRDDGTTR